MKKAKPIRINSEGIEKEPASDRKKAFLELIETYKLQNPVKYEHKKAAFQKQLESL